MHQHRQVLSRVVQSPQCKHVPASSELWTRPKPRVVAQQRAPEIDELPNPALARRAHCLVGHGTVAGQEGLLCVAKRPAGNRHNLLGAQRAVGPVRA
jgi:hypothetical protein